MTGLSTRAQDMDFTVHCHDNVCCLLRPVAVFDKTTFNKSCTKTCLLFLLPLMLWVVACRRAKCLLQVPKAPLQSLADGPEDDVIMHSSVISALNAPLLARRISLAGAVQDLVRQAAAVTLLCGLPWAPGGCRRCLRPPLQSLERLGRAGGGSHDLQLCCYRIACPPPISGIVPIQACKRLTHPCQPNTAQRGRDGIMGLVWSTCQRGMLRCGIK